MRSRDYYSLTGNIRGDSPEAVARRVTSHTEVAGLRGPTISKVYPKLGGEEGWYAATVVVQSKLLLQAIDALRRAGRRRRLGRAAPLHVPEQVLELRGAAPPALGARDATNDDAARGAPMIGPLIARYDDVDEARRELLARRSLGDAPLPAPVVQKIREVFGRDLTPARGRREDHRRRAGRRRRGDPPLHRGDRRPARRQPGRQPGRDRRGRRDGRRRRSSPASKSPPTRSASSTSAPAAIAGSPTRATARSGR